MGIDRLIALLDSALGDTDPQHEPDEHEDPVFHAFREAVVVRAELCDAQETIADSTRDILLEPVLKKRITMLEDELFRRGAMEDPPCFCCGYNGPGYYQPATHECAKRHHGLVGGPVEVDSRIAALEDAVRLRGEAEKSDDAYLGIKADYTSARQEFARKCADRRTGGVMDIVEKLLDPVFLRYGTFEPLKRQAAEEITTLRAEIKAKDAERWDLKESEARLKHLLGEALSDKESLEDYKLRYPPDFIEKMQQDIDERNVTITHLRTERSSLMKIMAQWYFSSMRQGWKTGHTEGEVLDEIVDYFSNSLHPEWPSGYDAEKTCDAVDLLMEEE
jgi:hypothetical protein